MNPFTGPAPIETIRWDPAGFVRILDQTRLPRHEVMLEIATVPSLIRSIRSLAIRGAPALGVAGAYGLALAAQRAMEAGHDPEPAVRRAARSVREARPTAVNLAVGVDLALGALNGAVDAGASREEVVAAVRQAGDRLLQEDLEASRRMAEAGLALVPQGKPILTHCNTGALATAGGGTALAVARAAALAGRVPEILVDETRPLLQGGRLTLWELRREGIAARLLCDGAAAFAIRRLGVGCILVGADRIAANGDTANKIGTFALSLAAAAHGIPFYVVAPWTTIDPAIPDGEAIPVEERGASEVVRVSGWGKPEPPAWNPAFDVTPASRVTAWVTDRGVVQPPFSS